MSGPPLVIDCRRVPAPHRLRGNFSNHAGRCGPWANECFDAAWKRLGCRQNGILVSRKTPMKSRFVGPVLFAVAFAFFLNANARPQESDRAKTGGAAAHAQKAKASPLKLVGAILVPG